jgi:hypothetical protein
MNGSKSKLSEKEYKFVCELCDFKCCTKKDYDRHNGTRKHRVNIGIEPVQKPATREKKQTSKNVEFVCECGKVYKARNGLWYHKKKCEISLEIASKPEDKKESEAELEIKKLKEQVAEMGKKQHNNEALTEQVGILTTALTTAITEGKLGNTTNSNNTTNNQFNLNIFLNEKCKDAMNITDFVDQIKLQLSDLETQGKVGYVDGISNIFIKNLDEMDEDKRPIHCTDTKREVLYVKNNDTWEKGDIGRDEMKKAIDKISKNNIQQFGKWINENPQCKVAHTPKADQFHEISSEIGGCSQEKNIDKVIRKIAKSTTIEKK